MAREQTGDEATPDGFDGPLVDGPLFDGPLPTPYVEAVLDVVASVPVGRVMTYGNVADRVRVGTGRHVGAALSRFGGGVPWHRIVRADGRPAAVAEVEALERLVAEGVPLRPTRDRVDLGVARWRG